MTLKDKTVNVVVVDDSPFMRKIISDILNSDDGIKVIGDAKNGKKAIEIIKELKPDVVTMDIEMPIMNGLDALKEIMISHPVPVVMLSSLTYHGAQLTMEALELGAIDFIQKPTNIFAVNSQILKKEIIQKVKGAHKAKLISCSKAFNSSPKPSIVLANKGRLIRQKERDNIIAIGISTGGPRALQNIIPLVPKNFPGSFLVVQHMPPGFTKSLAERLNGISNVIVKEAEDSEKILPAHIYIAPGNYHLGIKEDSSKDLFIELTQDPPVSGHRPSADVLFQSIAKTKQNNINITAVIMTGMGSDGTKGLSVLKEKKEAYIVAQDEESSVVYGMPKSALKAGVVDVVTPLEKIMDVIVKRVGV
ncbi:two-component system, chemotaxis family, response regulator CheB [Natronincola peptidivorans]|uniref:Protein-glutamate methylesterase/protein-glutamine glutaminase n=1 Tax=Natronincola peptidivorans TaxID=426128 RepID=A0A1H9YFT8_9FIRM|nr:chemotaxis response regulator protein-glutamate methylesterase [Natronincola peptidivorans]SES67896.1 two-component system, chemotaxis family, response regulator CheB [Natronincola peptidivorans]